MRITKKEDILKPLNSASPEIQKIIRRVLKLENERLHQKKPHLNTDIMRIVKEEIQ